MQLIVNSMLWRMRLGVNCTCAMVIALGFALSDCGHIRAINGTLEHAAIYNFYEIRVCKNIYKY